MVIRWHLLLAPLLILTLWAGTAAAVTVQAVADRDHIAAGESLQLQLRLDGSPASDPDLRPLKRDWDLLNRSKSSQMQIVNGSYSRSVVYTLTLMPHGLGTVTIPPICFGSDCSVALPIEVTQSATAGSSGTATLLLESEISPRQIVVQGELLLKIRLLRRIDLLQAQLSEPQPTGVDAVIKKLGGDRSYETRRKGLLYQVIERDYAVFPQGSGTLRIPALQLDGMIAGTNSSFDPFGRQGQRIRRNSQALQVDVTPVPVDLGQRPWIPARKLELQDDWQRQLPKFVVGEPATRTLTLSATGVQAAQLPELTLAVPAGFKSYPDQPNRKDQLLRSGIKGVLVQKIALVPMHPGRYQLPAVDLDWWNITTGKWQHAHLAGLNVEVAPATTAQVTSAPMVPLVTPAPPVKPVKIAPPTAPLPAALVVNGTKTLSAFWERASFWPWLCLGLVLGWLLTLVLLLRQRHQLVPSSPAPASADKVLNEKSIRRAVIQTAGSHDPRATRQALVLWSQTLWPEAQAGAYERLCQSADPILRRELENLDHCLYGSSDQDWRGHVLAEKISSWHPEQKSSASSTLPDLYPSGL